MERYFVIWSAWDHNSEAESFATKREAEDRVLKITEEHTGRGLTGPRVVKGRLLEVRPVQTTIRYVIDD